jgi:hypothetical protein
MAGALPLHYNRGDKTIQKSPKPKERKARAARWGLYGGANRLTRSTPHLKRLTSSFISWTMLYTGMIWPLKNSPMLFFPHISRVVSRKVHLLPSDHLVWTNISSTPPQTNRCAVVCWNFCNSWQISMKLSPCFFGKDETQLPQTDHRSSRWEAAYEALPLILYLISPFL